jgi:hypothetical protein
MLRREAQVAIFICDFTFMDEGRMGLALIFLQLFAGAVKALPIGSQLVSSAFRSHPLAQEHLASKLSIALQTWKQYVDELKDNTGGENMSHI